MANKTEVNPENIQIPNKALERRLVVNPSLKASIQLTAFKEGVDEKSKIYKEDYDLGVAKTEGEEVEEMRKQKASILVGSVDGTKFEMEWHKPKWYKQYTKAAAEVTKCLPLLDEQTRAWFKELEDGLKVFEDLEGVDERTFNRSIKSEIWKLVKAKGGDYIYGTKGILNFLLAFNRVKNIYPQLAEVTKEGFDLKELKVKTIRLNTGKAIGKEKGALERYAYMVVEEEKPEPVEPNKLPEYGTEAFYTHYEITEEQREDFNISHDSLNENKLSEKMALLSNSSIWDPLPGEGSTKQETRLAKMFNIDDGEMFTLYSDLINLRQVYPKFCADMSNPEAVHLNSAYFLVSKRLVEYLDEYSGSNLRFAKRISLDFHQSILESGNELYEVDGVDKKMIAQQLIISAEYMEENDPNPLNASKWKDLKAKYQKELV